MFVTPNLIPHELNKALVKFVSYNPTKEFFSFEEKKPIWFNNSERNVITLRFMCVSFLEKSLNLPGI